MRRIAPTTLLAALALTAAARPAPAISLDDAAAERRGQRAVDLINAATRSMRQAPACQRRWERTTTFSDAAPSASLQETLSLLRRPAIPADQFATEPSHGLTFIGARGVYRQWIRMGRAADGSEHYLVVARDRSRPAPLSRACLRGRHAALLQLLAGQDRRVRRLALRTEARLNRDEHRAAGFPRREAIYRFDRMRDGSIGGGGGGVDLAWFKRNGLFGSSQHGGDDLSRVTGLVPDGVATIEATFARRASRGPHRAPDVYPSDVKLTVPVQDNLVSFTVPREAPDAFPAQMIWRAADGSVVRTIRDRGRG